MSGIYFTYKNQGMIQESLYWLLKLYHKKEQMSVPEQLFTDWEYAQNFETPEVQLKYLRELHDIDDQNNYHYLMGSVYAGMKQYASAISEFETFMDEGRRKGSDHLKDNWVYPALGEVYHMTGQYGKEKRIYREAERNFSDHKSIAFSWVIRDQASLALSMGDTVKANIYMKKFINVMKENSATEADITDGLAYVYWNAGKEDQAEELFRKALFLEPWNPKRMNTLACRLIDRKKNFDEVSELLGKAMELAANKMDYYNYFDTKAWGLYRQGKYKESLELFQNIRDSIPYKMNFIYAHLEEIKKASAGLK
jgi:tetratricopeptide (TPR) repeat protein